MEYIFLSNFVIRFLLTIFVKKCKIKTEFIHKHLSLYKNEIRNSKKFKSFKFQLASKIKYCYNKGGELLWKSIHQDNVFFTIEPLK